jgi:hypothetical protein
MFARRHLGDEALAGGKASPMPSQKGREGVKRGHGEETKSKEVNQQAARLSFLLSHTRRLQCHCYHSSAH